MNLSIDDLVLLRNALMDATEVAASETFDSKEGHVAEDSLNHLRAYRRMLERIEYEISRARSAERKPTT